MTEEMLEVFEHQREEVLKLSVGSKESQIATDNVIKLYEAIQKSKNAELENSNKKLERKKENVDRWLKFGVDVGKVVLPLAVAVGMGLISMVWETDGHSMTNTTGRNSWRDLIRFR